MAVIYKPTTIAGYYETLTRVQRVSAQYEAITDPQEATRFHDEHWEDLKAVIEPPPVNALILAEFMESYERFTHHFAKSLLEFGKIPEHRIRDGWIPPTNAATLWRQINEGIERVADALTKPPEK
jgi:hypothetical protein